VTDHWWSLRKAAARFGRSERELRAAIQSGELVGIPAADGDDWFVRESDLLLLPGRPQRWLTDTLSPPRRGSPRILVLFFVVLMLVFISFFAVVNISGSTSCGGRPRFTEAILKQVGSQLEMFRLTHGRYPERLMDLVQKPVYVESDSWPKGGYLKDLPVDGWGREFVYRVPGTDGRAFDLFSVGTDGSGKDDPSTELWYHGAPNRLGAGPSH
jgi:general secretion pathway protein G